MNAAGSASRKYAPKYANWTSDAWNVLISKMRLNPATIGVVRSWATPHAVKQAIRAMNSTSMPLPTSGWLRALASSSAAVLSTTLLTAHASLAAERSPTNGGGTQRVRDETRSDLRKR